MKNNVPRFILSTRESGLPQGMTDQELSCVLQPGLTALAHIFMKSFQLKDDASKGRGEEGDDDT